MLSTPVPAMGKRREHDQLGWEFFEATTIKLAAGDVYDSSAFGASVFRLDYLIACLFSYLRTLSRRSVGAIKGFLVKELPARSWCVRLGFVVNQGVMASNGGWLERLKGHVRRNLGVATAQNLSGSNPTSEVVPIAEVTGRELVLHGVRQPEVELEDDDVVEFDLEEEDVQAEAKSLVMARFYSGKKYNV
jgi:hypothetical protein